MAEPFGQTCGLGDDELRYFVDLVAFKQATSLAERAKHYARLTGFQRYRKAHRLDTVFAPTDDAFEALASVPAGDTLRDAGVIHVIDRVLVP